MANADPSFDVIVVGSGMMGSACARHLAEMGVKVALIGPAEPERKDTHEGVFGSHYDEARITRRLDKSQDRARLSAAAMGRYAEIEQKGQQPFFHPVGSLLAGPETGDGRDYILNVQKVATDDEIAHVALRGEALKAQFPYLTFPGSILGLYEADAGWINPRHHVVAEITAAAAQGAAVHRSEVIEIKNNHADVHVHCKDGQRFVANKVVVACGAFSGNSGLLPDPIPMKVYARTIAFLEIGDSEIARLKGMPSIVYIPPDLSCDPYVLPPVLYPDGKTYLKIGGDPDDIEIDTAADLKAWFRSGGDPMVGDLLTEQLLKIIPDLSYASVSYDACATSFTRTSAPLIYNQTDQLTVLTGGNGAGAKCADELGRLGALVATGQSIPDDIYQSAFMP